MPSERVQRQIDRLLDGVEMHWCSVNWVVTGLVRKQKSETGNTVFPHDMILTKGHRWRHGAARGQGQAEASWKICNIHCYRTPAQVYHEALDQLSETAAADSLNIALSLSK